MKHLLSLFVSSLSLVICVAVVAASVQEATPPHVGAETQVTPQCKAARSQVWAAAAWSEQARCWLVVWREGYLNEDACDIWCARVGVDGKPLDPAGVRLTKGDGLKDMPHVASDGKGFLVVWEDLSNGRDWDVRGVLVSADGKVEGQDSILVAGGRHNQCRPDVTFAAGNYVVVWQGLTGDGSPNTPGTAYAVFAARVSPAGKRLDDKPIEVVAVQKASHAFSPVVTSHGNNVLAACYVSSFAAGNDYLARRAIDAAAGRALGPSPEPSTTARRVEPCFLRAALERSRAGALAMSDKEAIAVTGGGVIGLQWTRLSRAGELLDTPRSFGGRGHGNGDIPSFTPRRTLAFDGQQFLFVTDWSKRVQQQKRRRVRIQVRGWRIAAGGKLLDDAANGFVIAADAEHDLLLPVVAAGPPGVSLVVYSKRRGPDDMPLFARIVKEGKTP